MFLSQISNAFLYLFNDYTLRTVILGSGMLGILYGVLGCFTFLRRQSLLGDAISHAALPGIVIMFILTYSKNPIVLLGGGAVAGGIGTYLVHFITQKTKLKKDSALGIVLSVFFGFGLVLLTWVQKKAIAQQAILNKFLFGNASTLVTEEVVFIAVVALFILCCVAALWKEFTLLTFDQTYACTLNYQTKTLDLILTSLLVIAIVIGLQTIGVVLMSTMLIAPAAAARQWTKQLGSMIFLAACIGGCSSVVGAVISSGAHQLPTGPTIVVVVSLVVIFSLLVADKRY